MLGLSFYRGRDQDRYNTILARDLSHNAAFAINDHCCNLKLTTDIHPCRYLLYVAEQSEIPSYQSGIKVKANLLLASNGATSLDSKSAPLRTPEDGRKFHQIRQGVKAILIGGNTFRQEPYANTKIPVLVASAQLPESTSNNLAILNLNPVEVSELALARFGAPVLVEGGPNFLTPLMEQQIIDELFISKVPKLGNGDFFDLSLLHKYYQLKVQQQENNTVFETWAPKNK